MNAITARSLVIGRGGFRAGPFDFDVPMGALLAVVGQNGGGKSTLLRTFAGLLPPFSGRMEVRADDAALLPAPGAITVGFSAEHLVALGRARRAGWRPALRPTDRNAARAALVRLGIGALSKRPFDRLSSGQQQLVLMARLVAQDAGICLLDEPTAMLDPVQASNVAVALRGLADDGRAVVFATHDIALARVADFVLMLGSSPRQGRPDEVLTAATLSEAYGAPVELCPACGSSAMSRTTTS